jgi:hypothetical protein
MKNLSLASVAFAGFITGPAIATDLVAPFSASMGVAARWSWNVQESTECKPA